MMKPRTRYLLSLAAAIIGAALSYRPISQVIYFTVFADNGWCVDIGAVEGHFWLASITILVCDIVRQVAHRRVFPVRLSLELFLTAAAWATQHWWFFPYYEMALVCAGFGIAYILAILYDVRLLSTGEIQMLQAPIRSRWPALIWISLASAILVAGHAIVFWHLMPGVYERFYSSVGSLTSRLPKEQYGREVLSIQSSLSDIAQLMQFVMLIDALFLVAAVLCFSGYLRSEKKKANQTLVPTPISVTPAADAPVAPDTGAAHL